MEVVKPPRLGGGTSCPEAGEHGGKRRAKNDRPAAILEGVFIDHPGRGESGPSMMGGPSALKEVLEIEGDEGGPYGPVRLNERDPDVGRFQAQ